MSDIKKYSFSKIETFLSCKAKYKYVYIVHLPRKEQIFHTFGKLIHKTLEEFHNAYINGSKERFDVVMSNSYKLALEEGKDKVTQELKVEAKKLLGQYLKKHIDDVNKGTAPNILSCEKEFKFDIAENVVLAGAIDRIQIDNDGIYHVIDYKTMKNKSYIKKDFFQLATYAYHVLLENPEIKKIRASYSLCRFDWELVSREFTAEELLDVKRKYSDYVNSINLEEEFKTNVTPLCRFCEFVDICPATKDNNSYTERKSFGEVSW